MKKPLLHWHKMSSYCELCKDELVITELLANAEGELWFTLVCFRCGTKFETGLTLKNVVSHCYDLDFLTQIRVSAGTDKSREASA